MPTTVSDPAEALRRAFYGALSGGGMEVYSGGAVPADAEPPYSVIQIPACVPSETRTSTTWVTKGSVRTHTRFPQGQATHSVMYGLRSQARALIKDISRDLYGGYRMLRLRPPQQQEQERSEGEMVHIDGLLIYELRLQEL